MGYRNDQWFRFANWGESGEAFPTNYKNDSGYYIPESLNNEFIYPRRAVRVGKPGSNGIPTSVPLKRGYVRSLLTGDGLPVRRCQFQFNPSAINQSVSQNTSILNFLQMDKYQYSQPIPGNVTFQFDLFFDRSMELNGKALSKLYDSANEATTEDPWRNLGPEKVGVLHDLSALYSIIGVGVSDYMESRVRESAQEYYNFSIDAAIDRNTTQLTSEDVTSDASTERQEYRDSVNELIGINKGNSAFLLPLPVRIVFSSLYIVEGLVQDFNVLFTKFTTEMVPMQCSVTVTFEAKYIGFAKKDTFFTDVLEDLESNPNRGSYDYNTVTDVVAENATEIINELGQVIVAVVDDGAKYKGISDGFPQENSNNTLLTRFIEPTLQDDGNPKDKYLKVLFPSAGNAISNLFQQQRNISIAVEAKATCYRFTQEFVDNSSKAQAALQSRRGSSGYRDLADSIEDYIADFSRGDSSKPFTTNFGYVNPSTGSSGPYWQNAVKLWELNLSDGNVISEDEDRQGVATASTTEEWLDMKDWACVSQKGLAAEDDRNTVSENYPERNQVIDIWAKNENVLNSDPGYNYKYLVEFICLIKVTIDDQTFYANPRATIQHILSEKNLGITSDISVGFGPNLYKTLTPDWSEVRSVNREVLDADVTPAPAPAPAEEEADTSNIPDGAV
jgi:hypothetical protein